MLLTSLRGRLFAFAIFVSVVLLAVAGLLLSSTDRTHDGFLWAGQTENVIRAVDELVGDVREAESGQRGYLLTHSAAYLDTFNQRIEGSQHRITALAGLVREDADQSRRVLDLRDVLGAKVTSLRQPLRFAQKGQFAEATTFVASGRGRTLMEDVSRRSDEIKAAAQSLLTMRMEAAERQALWNHDIILIGGPALAIVFFALIFLLVRRVRRPLDALFGAIQALADGDMGARAVPGSGLSEVDRLAIAYNAMADRLTQVSARQAVSDTELQVANKELRTRGHAIELLGGMAHRMQASRTDDELADVLRCFLPRVLPDAPGALYVHNNSRNLLCRVADWGEIATLPDSFAPDACWALRRGQGHFVVEAGADVRCRHVTDDARYHCEPVLAGGEVVGLLYLEGLISMEDRFRLAALTENIALALVNQRLQRGLREQSIRDPLTGLFNRRYMEETLAVEVARAQRSGQPLGVIMCDVDHFKRFNDEYGHAAGDVVLQAVAAALHDHFRGGDVVCRYGGEEFAVIAPTGDLVRLEERAEELREIIARLAVRHDGRALGRVTMSFGLASLQPAQTGEEVVHAADVALYRAKQEGRDRVIVDLTTARRAA